MYVGHLYVTFKPPDSVCLLFRRGWCTWVTFISPLSPLTVCVCCLGGCGVRGYLYVTFKPPDSVCLLFRRVWCTWVTFMSPLSPLTVCVCCLGGCGVRGLRRPRGVRRTTEGGDATTGTHRHRPHGQPDHTGKGKV